MRIALNTSQSQKLILTPALKQSIELLLLPIIELETAVQLELQNNPLLEVPEYTSEAEKTISSLLDTQESFKNFHSDPNWTDDDQNGSKVIEQNTSLEQYLSTQLHIEFNLPENILIGEYIIGNLNDDGYLNISCEEIAQNLNVELATVERILNKIQHFDPLGIASRNIQECLCLQAEHKLNGKSGYAKEIINNHLTELSRKKFCEIGKKIGLPADDVKNIAHVIASFEPKPARNFKPIETNIYITPDLYINKNAEGHFTLEVNRQRIPKISINRTYQNLLSNAHISNDEREFIKQKIKDGQQFIRNLEQRHQTLEKVGLYIMAHQKDFLEHGPSELRPMTLKDIARVIERNESTVSRAVDNKYIDTPHGLFPIKYFFCHTINDTPNNQVVSQSVKEEMKTIFENEDKTNPLSDQEIQELFQQRGVSLARRTVSKYRKALAILPSHLRRG